MSSITIPSQKVLFISIISLLVILIILLLSIIVRLQKGGFDSGSIPTPTQVQYPTLAITETPIPTATPTIAIVETATPTPKPTLTPKPTAVPTSAPIGFTVTSVAASVDKASDPATCPHTFTFTGYITANMAGTANYRWERSDFSSGPSQTIIFTESGTKQVTDTWQLGTSTSGWGHIKIDAPIISASNNATFDLHCS